jgi:hypothetical protein
VTLAGKAAHIEEAFSRSLGIIRELAPVSENVDDATRRAPWMGSASDVDMQPIRLEDIASTRQQLLLVQA